MNTAVTESTSAVETTLDKAMETGFLPDDPHYRLTGEFKSDPPSEKDEDSATSEKKDQIPPVNEEDSATSSAADNAAASATAPTQEKEVPRKTSATSESRWQKITRENKELRDRLTKLEAPPVKRDTQQAPQPVKETQAKAKPKIDDVDPKTNKPKYATYEDYEDARDTWNRQEVIREFNETSAKTQRETSLQAAKQTVAREWGTRVETAVAKYADFADVALNPDLPLKEGSVADVFILDSPVGTDVLYYLGQNPKELDRINALNPIAQARELTKIELQFADKKPTPVRPVTQAPRPAHQVSGKGTVAKDAVEQAVEDGDTETYMREANARELSRRGK